MSGRRAGEGTGGAAGTCVRELELVRAVCNGAAPARAAREAEPTRTSAGRPPAPLPALARDEAETTVWHALLNIVLEPADAEAEGRLLGAR